MLGMALLLVTVALLAQQGSAWFVLPPIVPPGICYENFDTCKMGFLTGGSCAITSNKCRNGLGPALDGFARVATLLSAPLVTSMRKKLKLDGKWTSPFIGFLNRLNITTLIRKAMPVPTRDASGAKICSVIPVPLYSAATLAMLSTACAQLVLPANDARYIVLTDTLGITGIPGCLAIDPCTASFSISSLGKPIVVYNADQYDPVTVVTCKVAVDDINTATLSLFGHETVQSSVALWNLAAGGTGSFSMITATGHIRLRAFANITVAVLYVSLNLHTDLSVLVNFDDKRNGVVGGDPDHMYFIESSKVGPTLSLHGLFRNGSMHLGVDHGVVNLSRYTSINTTINWYCHGVSDFLLEGQFEGAMDLTGVLSGLTYPWDAVQRLVQSTDNISLSLSVFANPTMWGLYIVLKTNISLITPSPNILNTIGWPQGPGNPPFPTGLPSGAALVITGRPDVMGAKLTVVPADPSGNSSPGSPSLFSVNYCTKDDNCVADGYCAINPGDAIGACSST